MTVDGDLMLIRLRDILAKVKTRVKERIERVA
jgi:hypothetical protein